jgi:hypothetical protein
LSEQCTNVRSTMAILECTRLIIVIRIDGPKRHNL